MQILTKRLIIFFDIPLLLFASTVQAQDSILTLEKSYALAEQNYPMIKQRDLVKQTAQLNIENLTKGYLPQISLSGQATYQSDVTKIDVFLPGFNFSPTSRDQYKVVGDVNQLIYDGGVIRLQKVSQQLNEEVDEQKVEVELYKLKDRINQIYLGALYLDDQLKQSDLVKQDLRTG